MLTITIPELEVFDEKTGNFSILKSKTLQMEHSLVSLSKWESKWKKPFFKDDDKTAEELLDYIKCMTITQNVPDYVYHQMSQENVKQINDYIHDSMTATTISNPKKSTKSEIVTSELLYFYMTAFNIPDKCEKWHINRLIMLIRVCSIKNSTPEKMNKQDYFKHRKALNQQRKAKSKKH